MHFTVQANMTGGSDKGRGVIDLLCALGKAVHNIARVATRELGNDVVRKTCDSFRKPSHLIRISKVVTRIEKLRKNVEVRPGTLHQIHCRMDVRRHFSKLWICLNYSYMHAHELRG